MARTSQRESLAHHTTVITGKPKTVARSTFQYTRQDGAKVTRLHFTDIIFEYPDGSFMVTTGGWKTITTKDRLNNHMPRGWNIYSQKGVWFVTRNGERVPFFDGMILPHDFKPHEGDAKAREQYALKKKIDSFVNRTAKNGQPLPVPSSGDCWFCSMFFKETGSKFQANGKPPHEDTDHLLSHVEEGYMHGSLIVNAMRYAGYADVGISLHLQFADHGTIRRAVKRYLYRKLGLAT